MKNKVREIIEEKNPKALFLPHQFDPALMGTSKTCGKKEVAAYDASECLRILIKEQHMDELEALEYFEQTVDKGSPGSFKPVFINDFRKIRTLPEELIKYINEGKGTIDELSKFPNL
jgi:hypothetical protein